MLVVLGRLGAAFRFGNAVGGVETGAELRFGLERRWEVVRMLGAERSVAAVAIAAGTGYPTKVVERSIAAVELAVVRNAAVLHSLGWAEELMLLSTMHSVSLLETLRAALTREVLGLF